jgi:hypothetical protein
MLFWPVNKRIELLYGMPASHYNFTRGSVLVWNLDPDIKGGTWIEGAWEQGAEENIWILEG